MWIVFYLSSTVSNIFHTTLMSAGDLNETETKASILKDHLLVSRLVCCRNFSNNVVAAYTVSDFI